MPVARVFTCACTHTQLVIVSWSIFMFLHVARCACGAELLPVENPGLEEFRFFTTIGCFSHYKTLWGEYYQLRSSSLYMSSQNVIAIGFWEIEFPTICFVNVTCIVIQASISLSIDRGIIVMSENIWASVRADVNQRAVMSVSETRKSTEI